MKFGSYGSRLKGFTLIELLVVISIIGLLAAIGVVNFNKARIKGRDAKRKADLATIQSALENYYDDNRTYPSTLTLLVPTYVPIIATDPKTDDRYIFFTDGARYVIAAGLENTTDRLTPGVTYASGSETLCAGAGNNVYVSGTCRHPNAGYLLYQVSSGG